MDMIRRILDSRVYDVALQTPLDPMVRLSQRLSRKVLLKREDLQPVFSFKIRGAYNRIARLSEEAKAKGVICASAGNHAQGVALSGKKLGIKATIVMPVTTPAIKIDAVRYWGGQVVLFGDTFDEAYAHARQLEAEQGLTFVHPYDDEDVIAGQGTIAIELLRQAPDLDAVFIATGGGGLMSGIGSCLRHFAPRAEIIGCWPENSAVLYRCLQADRLMEVRETATLSESTAGGVEAGSITFEKSVRKFI